MKAGKKLKWKKSIPLYLMILPGMGYLLINNYLPMSGIIVAFKEYSPLDGIWGSEWNGVENFKFLFQSSDIIYILRNTLLYNMDFLILNTLLSVLLAVLLAEITNRLAVKFYQTTFIVPSLLSTVVLSYLVLLFLDERTGFVNHSILGLLDQDAVSWYQTPAYWPFILAFVNTWRNVGKMSIIYYAAIIGFDASLYEAAEIDGASRWKKIRYITLPQLRPVVAVMTIIGIGRIFTADFGLFYQVTLDSGALYSVTNVFDTYVYRALIQLNDVGMSSAAGLFQSVFGFCLVMITNLILRRKSPENALF